MDASFNLAAYLARIGYAGPRTATFETLKALHAAHPAAIPFENIDVLIKRPIRLDLPSIVDKLIVRRRGGYCYEQNLLLLAALQALGFKVRMLGARVQWNAEGVVTARNHMVLLVSLPDGDALADVGFGGLTLTAPLRLHGTTEQTTPHGVYRVVPQGEEFQVQARVDGRFAAMYQLNLADEAPADWEMANWYISTAPDSIFVRTLVVARPIGDSRYALRNNRLRIHRADGTTEQRTIESAKELESVLRNEFGLNLPPGEDLGGVMATAGV